MRGVNRRTSIKKLSSIFGLKIKKIALFLTFLLVVIFLIIVGFRGKELITASMPLGESRYSIESNFFNFSVQSFGVAPRSVSLLTAVKPIDSNRTLIYTANRATSEIKGFLYKPNLNEPDSSRLEFKDKYNLSDLEKKLAKSNSKGFIFDVLIDDNSLLISYVYDPADIKECVEFKVLSVPIRKTVLEITQAQEVYNSNKTSCIHVDTLSFNSWHDFQGRLAVSNKNIYLTAGMVIAATYDGYYPDPRVSGVDNNLKKELDRDQLFTGVIRIQKESLKAERIARGFRGPSGIAVREFNNLDDIWVSDHGPRGGDELNKITTGGDYGWPWVSFGKAYFENKDKVPGFIDTKSGSHEGYDPPVYYWTPSIGTSQIVFLKEDIDKYKDWETGDLVLGSLKAKSLFRIKLNKSNDVVSVEKIELNTRIRDLDVANKTIFVSTDDGRILILNLQDYATSQGAFPPVENKNSPIYQSLPWYGEIEPWVDKYLIQLGYFVKKIIS